MWLVRGVYLAFSGWNQGYKLGELSVISQVLVMWADCCGVVVCRSLAPSPPGWKHWPPELTVGDNGSAPGQAAAGCGSESVCTHGPALSVPTFSLSAGPRGHFYALDISYFLQPTAPS